MGLGTALVNAARWGGKVISKAFSVDTGGHSSSSSSSDVAAAIESAQRESRIAARASEIAAAQAAGRAEAREKALSEAAQAAQAKKAETIKYSSKTKTKKKGVQSTYTAYVGSGAGMMRGTSFTPIGNGATGAISG